MAFHNNPRIVTKDLIGCWDANMKSSADSGAKLYDRVGSNDATLYNGNCLDFDGTDDNIYTTSDITMSGACTVALWVYSETGTNYIFSNKSGGPVNLMWRLYSNYLDYYYYVAPWKSMLSTSTISLNTWTHIAWTRSSDNYISFFINGELDKRDQATNGSDVDTSTTVNGPVNIVGGYWGSADFNGKMADFKVFNVELSPAQIKEMYKDSKVVVPRGVAHSNMELWYPMSEGAGSVVYDGGGVAGSANNPGIGQNFNDDEFLTGQAGAPQLVTGYNRPMWFDDTNDYVAMGTTNPMQFIWSDNFSLSAWIFCDSVSGFKHIIGKTYGNYRFCQNGGTISFRLDTNVVMCAATCLSAKKWHHVVATYQTNSPSAGGTAKIYCDGSLLNTCANTSLDWTSTGGTFQIGNSPGENYYFGGIINECIAYDKTLSLSEVQALGNTDANGGPLPPNPMGLADSGNVVGYWRNDGDVTWKDRSSNSNNGTVSGSPSALLLRQGYNKGRDTQGFPLLYRNNGAVGFNGGVGNGSYLNLGTCPSAFEMGQTSEATILAWIKVGKQSGENGIISAFYSTGSSGWSLVTYQASYNKAVSMLVSDGADGSGYWMAQAGTKLPEITADGRFHHVAVTISRISGTTTVYFYQDNVKNTTAKVFSNEGGSTAWGSGRTLLIGRGANGWGDFNGQIGNVQFYNRVLTDEEIKQNYNVHRVRFGE